MELRQMFDTLRNHLLSQMQKSEREGLCVYRRTNGQTLMCGVGIFISDQAYNPDLESNGVCQSVVQDALIASGVITENEAYMLGDDSERSMLECGEANQKQYLLVRGQQIHDNWEPEEWARRLNILKTELFPPQGVST